MSYDSVRFLAKTFAKRLKLLNIKLKIVKLPSVINHYSFIKDANALTHYSYDCDKKYLEGILRKIGYVGRTTKVTPTKLSNKEYRIDPENKKMYINFVAMPYSFIANIENIIEDVTGKIEKKSISIKKRKPSVKKRPVIKKTNPSKNSVKKPVKKTSPKTVRA